MEIQLDIKVANGYKSRSQIIRVISEAWGKLHLYCPNCGYCPLKKYKDNTIGKDFFCTACNEKYELKATSKKSVAKLTAANYRKTIDSIFHAENPNFIVLQYEPKSYLIKNVFAIPRHLFNAGIVKRRLKLKKTARRSGWQGCYILLDQIPADDRVFCIRGSVVIDKDLVYEAWRKAFSIKQVFTIAPGGWLNDVMGCIREFNGKEFSLADVYRFEEILRKKHSSNRHVLDKVRQQLQILRNKGYLEFINDRGKYKEIKKI